jgi:hypothetical protein
VVACMAHTAGDTGLRMWLDRNADDDMRVHCRRFGGEVAHEQGSELQGRTGGSRLRDHPASEGEGHIGR